MVFVTFILPLSGDWICDQENERGFLEDVKSRDVEDVIY